jgi:hypothetical protein
MGRSKISTSAPPPQAGAHIPAVSTDPFQKLLKFSFRFFDGKTDDFSPRRCADRETYVGTLLDRLKSVSSMTIGDLLNEAAKGSKSLRAHSIKWDGSETHSGFSGLPSHPQVRDAATNYARQFSLDKEANGRVHGFTIGSVFYVVWIDPDHRLYSNRDDPHPPERH